MTVVLFIQDMVNVAFLYTVFEKLEKLKSLNHDTWTFCCEALWIIWNFICNTSFHMTNDVFVRNICTIEIIYIDSPCYHSTNTI